MAEMTQSQYYPPRAQQRPFSGRAIAAFVFSLLWLGGVGSLVAIILGGTAMRRTTQRNEAGRGLAVAALIIGILGLLVAIWFFVLVVVAGNAVSDQFQTLNDCLNSGGDASSCSG